LARLTELNDKMRTVMVAPMTSKGFAALFRVPVSHAGTKVLIVLDQLRTGDKVRLAKKLGSVSPKTLSAALGTLQEMFVELDCKQFGRAGDGSRLSPG
jgi:mRNA interferase MazF